MKRSTHSIIFRNYAGGISRAKTPSESTGGTFETVARFSPGENKVNERFSAGDCVAISSNLFPVETAGDFIRWIAEPDAKALDALDAEISSLVKKKKRLYDKMFGCGRPITTEECKSLA